MTRVAINGFGRIGRATCKLLIDAPEFDLVAINDLVPPDNLAYLFQYDTVYGRYPKTVQAEDHHLVIDGKKYPVLHEKDPAHLPWPSFGVDIVFECAGVFNTRDELQKHLAQTFYLH